MNSSPGQNIIVPPLPPVKTGLSIYVLVGIVILFTIFASVVSYSRNLFVLPSWIPKLPVLGQLFKGDSSDPAGDMPNGGPAPVTYPNGGQKESIPESSNVSNDSAKQVWCLVGEDMAGRWCVEVPNQTACDTDRTFTTKNACEGGM